MECKVDQYPEALNFDWNELREVIQRVESELTWDKDLRGLLLDIVIRLLKTVQEQGCLDFCNYEDLEVLLLRPRRSVCKPLSLYGRD